MSRIQNVNSNDIADAIRLGCRTMQNVFNADDNNVPFFRSLIQPEVLLGFSSAHSESHVPGRHLNGLLEAEDVVGLRIDEEAIENHRRAAILSYSGPLALPLNREEIGGPLVNFRPHNLREGFHALYALARFRDDEEARKIAERSINSIFELWNPSEGWNKERISDFGVNLRGDDYISGEARMLGPLVKYYRATGYGRALELALVLKDKAVSEYYLEDGSFDPERFVTGHVHSITCVLSSLAQLADLLDDVSLMARVKAFYQKGLWQMRDEIGWTPESINQKDSDHGEANNTGDVLETALILGRSGYSDCYQDAERIIRCHLLPSQLRDVSFISDPPNPHGVDGLHDVANRHLGAFGFPAPYGHKSIGKGRTKISFNMDIVGGAIGSLCAAYREVARSETTGQWVNLLFDHETSEVKIESPYVHSHLRIEPKESKPLFVRIPGWANQQEIWIEGNDSGPLWTNGYFFFPNASAGQGIEIHFPLKESNMVLNEQLHVQPIRVKLKGDAVAAMDNFGADLTYFEMYPRT